jgi:hypothetical protein
VEKSALWIPSLYDRLPKWQYAMAMGGWIAPACLAIGGFMEQQDFCSFDRRRFFFNFERRGFTMAELGEYQAELETLMRAGPRPQYEKLLKRLA